MEEYKEIIIHWSKRINIDEIKELDTDNVLYQIYGDHHIYGRVVLLYIGKSINAETRIKAHLKSFIGRVNNLSVSIGKIDNYNDNLLEIPESILIANHKPSHNKEFIHDLTPDAKKHKIIVINNGNNEMLNTCCTNFWWVPKR